MWWGLAGFTEAIVAALLPRWQAVPAKTVSAAASSSARSRLRDVHDIALVIGAYRPIDNRRGGLENVRGFDLFRCLTRARPRLRGG